MRGYTASSIDKEYQRIFYMAEQMVSIVPDLPTSRLRCHELARAVHRCLEPLTQLKVSVLDGRYSICDHSWLEVWRGVGYYPYILDVYCVGRLPMVSLLDTCVSLPHLGNYRVKIKDATHTIPLSEYYTAYKELRPNLDFREDIDLKIVDRLCEDIRNAWEPEMESHEEVGLDGS